MNYHKYSFDEIEFIRNNSVRYTVAEMTRQYNIHFKSQNISPDKISYICKKYKIKCIPNTSTQFKKGHKVWNTGKKIKLHPNSGFKKGNIPFQWRPIFSERINQKGFIEIKIDNKRTWKLKHRYIYENYYKCKIPKDYIIIFLDHNKKNLNINNLYLVPKKVHSSFANLIKGKNIKNPEITKSYIYVAQLKVAINELKMRAKNGI